MEVVECLSGCSKGIGPLPRAVGRGGVGRRRGREGRETREGSDIVVNINYNLQPVIILRQITNNYIFMTGIMFFFLSFFFLLNYISLKLLTMLYARNVHNKGLCQVEK